MIMISQLNLDSAVNRAKKKKEFSKFSGIFLMVNFFVLLCFQFSFFYYLFFFLQ